MRVSSVLLAAALATCAVDAAAAPPRRAASAARRKAPAARPEPAAAKEALPETEDLPGDAPAPAAEPAPAAPAPDANSAIDDTPPSAASSTGQRTSPLTPEPGEMPGRAAPPGPAGLERLMSDIATLRARVAALTTALFSSKLRVAVRTDGDDARVESFVVTLDDGVVYRAAPGFVAGDGKVVYEHAVAPGSHVLGVEVERRDARGPAYRTWQTTRFAVTVPERRTLQADVRVSDDSDMGEDFPEDQDGEYDLAVTVRARVAD